MSDLDVDGLKESEHSKKVEVVEYHKSAMTSWLNVLEDVGNRGCDPS